MISMNPSTSDFYSDFWDSLTLNPTKRIIFLPESICHVFGWTHGQRRTEIQGGQGFGGQVPGYIELKDKDNIEETQDLYYEVNVNKKHQQNQEIWLEAHAAGGKIFYLSSITQQNIRIPDGKWNEQVKRLVVN